MILKKIALNYYGKIWSFLAVSMAWVLRFTLSFSNKFAVCVFMVLNETNNCAAIS
jgi:hypothetical protein